MNRPEQLSGFLKFDQIAKETKLAAQQANQQAFQTEEVVGNPLAQLEISERELTPQEQTVIWANQMLEEHNNLPKGNARERRLARNLAVQTARYLIGNPQDIDTAGSVWKSRAITKEEEQNVEKKQKTESFYDLVKQEASRDIRENWGNVSPEQLAQLVKTYANSVLTQDFAHDLLANYFKGPTSRRQRIDAYYNLASSALDLVEDQKAFNEAIRISLCDTNILPRDPYLLDYNLLIDVPYEDDKTLQKLFISQNVFRGLSFISSEDFEQVRQENMTFTSLSNSNYMIMSDKEWEKGIKRLGADELTRRNNAILELLSFRMAGEVTSEEHRAINAWPGNLILDENDPLNQKFRRVALEKANFEASKKEIARKLKEEGVDNVAFLSIASPEGFMIDLSIPQELIGRKSDVVRYALNLKYSKEEKNFGDESTFWSLTYGTFVLTEFESSPVLLTLRRSSGFERNQHPLQSLETIGFPNPQLENGQELPEANQELADEVRKTQLRFLNRRGVRVPLGRTMLSDFGYSNIDFHKDADDPEKTLVKIFVGDTPYSVKLDRYLNFDFEGKRFNAPFIHDSLKFTALSYLKPILCEERIQTPTGEEKDLDIEVVSRMGHLRLLPPNLHRTQQAVANCFYHEGKDLVAQDAERREMLRLVGNPIPRDREYTYVRPVIEKEENLPPIEINLPGVVRFSHQNHQVSA